MSLPPQASINPSPLSRRRSDYVDQSQEALSGSGLGVNGINGIHPNAINGMNGIVVGTNGARGTVIDYPTLTSQQILRPPPVAVSSTTMERQDNRPRVLQSQVSQYHPGPPHPTSPGLLGAGPTPPTLANDYPVKYWGESQIGTSGLRNLGNTCYMNSTIQCLSATVPFAMFFRGELNLDFASVARRVSKRKTLTTFYFNCNVSFACGGRWSVGQGGEFC